MFGLRFEPTLHASCLYPLKHFLRISEDIRFRVPCACWLAQWQPLDSLWRTDDLSKFSTPLLSHGLHSDYRHLSTLRWVARTFHILCVCKPHQKPLQAFPAHANFRRCLLVLSENEVHHYSLLPICPISLSPAFGLGRLHVGTVWGQVQNIVPLSMPKIPHQPHQGYAGNRVR